MSRLSPDTRKKEILDAALALARIVGYQNITRKPIAERAGCAPGLVHRYFETMGQLKRAVMRAAVHDGVIEVIAQGLAAGDAQARKAAPALKEKAANYIAG